MSDLYEAITRLCVADIQKNRDLAKVFSALASALTDMFVMVEKHGGEESPTHKEFLKIIEERVTEELKK